MAFLTGMILEKWGLLPETLKIEICHRIEDYNQISYSRCQEHRCPRQIHVGLRQDTVCHTQRLKGSNVDEKKK